MAGTHRRTVGDQQVGFGLEDKATVYLAAGAARIVAGVDTSTIITHNSNPTIPVTKTHQIFVHLVSTYGELYPNPSDYWNTRSS